MRKYRRLYSISIASLGLLVALLSACVNGGGYDHSGYCADWAEITVGELVLQNNVWRKQGITSYEQCIYKTSSAADFPCGWTWVWPEPPGGVKSYPEIIFGWKSWSPSSTTTDLPKQLSSITDLTVSYSIAQSAAGSYNLAFDIWLNSANPPAPENITGEIMIWLDRAVMVPAGEFKETVTLDGETYDFYMGSVSSGPWTYFAFVKQTPEFSGDTKVKLFFDYLVNNGHVSNTEYCSSVEIGNEIVSGSGRTEFANYAVTVN